MKKSIFLVAATVLFTLALAACSSGSNNGTATPGAYGPGGTSQPGTGLGGTPTESTGLGGNATETTGGAVSTQPTGAMTETQSTGVMTGTQSTMGETPVAGAANNQLDAGRLKDLLKFEVVDQAGNKIGKVSNLVLNFDTGKVDYILVRMGGILGIGGKQVAVPCTLFQFPGTTSSITGATGITSAYPSPVAGGAASTPATGTTNENANKNNVLILTVDKATLDNAPKFDTNLLPKFGTAAGDWDTQFKTYWSQYSGGAAGGVSSTPAVGGAVSTPATGMSSTPAGNAGSGASAIPMGTKLQGIILADQLMKMNITDGASTKIGSVKDIVIDTANCQFLYVVIDYAGNANMSSGTPAAGVAASTPAAGLNSTPGAAYAVTPNGMYYPVPPQAFSIDKDGKSLALTNAGTLLTGAPSFPESQFPSTMTPDWDKDIKTYWSTKVTPNTP